MLPEIPPYEVIRQVGQGGAATVYQARQPSLSRMVALKVLPPYFAHDEDLVGRFKLEATAVAKLRHPHIVQVYDFGRVEDYFYLAMELVEGGSLQERLAKAGRLGVTETIKLIRQVGEGLHHAHERKIIHRDIKPSNILLTPDGDAVLTDFGIVKMLEGSKMTNTASAGIGTAEYMSPEQSQGEPVDCRSDLYALGVVFYELLTGQLPFSDENPMVIMHRQVYENPVSPALINPAVRADVAATVLKLMAKNPEDRFSDAAELLDALSALSGSAAAGAGIDIVGSPTLHRRDTRLFRPPKNNPPAAATGPSQPAPVFKLNSPQMAIVAFVLVALALTGFGAGRILWFSGFGESGPGSVDRVAVQSAGDTTRSGPAKRPPRDSKQPDFLKTVEATAAQVADTTAAPGLISVTIEPASLTLTVGQTAGLRAIGLFTDDSTRAIGVDWGVSDGALARIGATGVLEALAVGVVQVEVRASTGTIGMEIESGMVTAAAWVDLVAADPGPPPILWQPARRRYTPPRQAPPPPEPEPAQDIPITIN